MKSVLLSWQLWALLSAAFAALTAIFAKVGVENVNSDFATFVRTIVILMALGAISRRHPTMAAFRVGIRSELPVPDPLRARHGRLVGVLFPRP